MNLGRKRLSVDAAAAEIEAQIGREEIPHAAFALHWLDHFAGSADFETWRTHLVAPLTPTMMKGHPINGPDREKAGYSPEFVEALARWA